MKSYESRLGCEGQGRKERRGNVIWVIGGFFILLAVGFVSLTTVQLVRAHGWYTEAAELAQEVDKFAACGEYESYQKCMDRMTAVYSPEVGQKLLTEVRDMLAKGDGGYWPANTDYVWEDGVIGAKTSLRVDMDTLTKSMAKHPSRHPTVVNDDNG
jgi:hypothetical protein